MKIISHLYIYVYIFTKGQIHAILAEKELSCLILARPEDILQVLSLNRTADIRRFWDEKNSDGFYGLEHLGRAGFRL
jgi:hypothetical protein